MYHLVSWKEQSSKFLPFFLPSRPPEGNNFFLFFFFKLCFVWTKCNVRYACLSWCFSCGRDEKKITPGWKVLGFFVVIVEARVQKMLLGWRENLVSFYLTTCKWASICLAKRKMISLFRKIVLLPSFKVTKKVFLWIFFWKKNLRQFASADEWIERTCVSQRKKILGWLYSFCSLMQEAFFSLFFLSFCLFCCPKMETVFRVVIFLICFAIQKVPCGVTNFSVSGNG